MPISPRRERPKTFICVLAIVSVAASIFRPHTVIAQPCPECSEINSATAAEQVALLSINALIGGVTAGIIRLAHGGPLRQAAKDAFWRGATGGGMSYVGKRVAASGFDGAGFLGREISAVGASLTANAGDGIGSFNRILLPLGPVPIRLALIRGNSGLSVRPLVDLASSAAFVYGIAAGRYGFDWESSMSSGAAVFRERSPYIGLAPPGISGSEGMVGATTIGGTIFTSYLAPEEHILAHERVHTLQFDYLVTTVGDRADTWAMERFPTVDNWLKINLVPTAFGGFNQVLKGIADNNSLPWEREANLLSGHN